MTRVDPAAFRGFFGSIPTAVAVVTTADADGRPQGFTCNAFSAVSPDPPLLLVCADRGSRTLPSLLLRRAFAVHLLADDGEPTARAFAGRAQDKFEGLRWLPGAAVPGVPILDQGVLAHAECSLLRAVEVADHTLLIGRMETARVRPRRPVLYQRGSFRAWGGLAEEVVQA
ncbi:flavin reductase family protein [Streptomyces sp. NBC_00878]|uniref:flavin reductase family protein n=1 Tax=Streptomyces sp. NBC_00878 TaxID=2975854 RepID=UPI0022545A66|nr:flavin reductase family protein [Streptomyces sp. NBC_00878]MCX4906896.1 flavin reductase family protein [Streptomyces sp. NBC_00878]